MTAAERTATLPGTAPAERPCGACGEPAVEVFFEQRGVPVTSNRMFTSREEALACPRGDLRLGLCHACGLIANVAFEADAVPAEDYESSQSSSAHFRRYADDLAQRWIQRHDLAGRAVLEVGCGRGEFLAAFCRRSRGRGIGVDPVLAGGPADEAREAGGDLRWVAEPFAARHLSSDVAAVVSRHTLEHVAEPRALLEEVRRAIGDREVVLLLEVPDVAPILRETAFWDVYYEHCNYFSAPALTRLLHRTGFEVTHAERHYDGQYLVVDARPLQGQPEPVIDDRRALWQSALAFREEYDRFVQAFRRRLQDLAARGRQVVLWGAGSKATGLLTALEDRRLAACVVDVNPRKQGTFIAGTGHPVVAPGHLRGLRPDVVVMMNPVYRDEIAAELGSLGVDARLAEVRDV